MNEHEGKLFINWKDLTVAGMVADVCHHLTMLGQQSQHLWDFAGLGQAAAQEVARGPLDQGLEGGGGNQGSASLAWRSRDHTGWESGGATILLLKKKGV